MELHLTLTEIAGRLTGTARTPDSDAAVAFSGGITFEHYLVAIPASQFWYNVWTGNEVRAKVKRRLWRW